VLDIFMNIFAYVTSRKIRIAPGHTLQIAENIYLKFSELSSDNPWKDFLRGKGETLELKRITREEINKK
jgi:hypothetical protein